MHNASRIPEALGNSFCYFSLDLELFPEVSRCSSSSSVQLFVVAIVIVVFNLFELSYEGAKKDLDQTRLLGISYLERCIRFVLYHEVTTSFLFSVPYFRGIASSI